MDYSIEYAYERIYHPRTKEYFQEVINSYYNSNYRSSVVMLYSVVICDLIYKVRDLRDLYNDPVATSIINEIEQLQQNNPRSSEWESRLVELVQERTSLLDAVEKQHIDNLKLHRHLSAHPVMNDNYILFKPNKETVRAHIRNTLESVLIKPPLLSRRITSELLTELSRIGTVMLDDHQLSRFLENKYLRHFTPEVEQRIFRDLWKIVFKIENADCDINREINFRALKVMLNRNQRNLESIIDQEKDYYSDISIGTPSEYLIKLLGEFPLIYRNLNDSCKAIIESTVNPNLDFYIPSFFISANLGSHIEAVSEKLRADQYCDVAIESFNKLLELSRDEGLQNSVFNLMIHTFKKSWNFDRADFRYNQLIKPHLPEYNSGNFLNLLEAINSNNQIYWRNSIVIQNREIKQYSDAVLGTGFNYADYFHFHSNL